mgnify:CR=1 FL=1
MSNCLIFTALIMENLTLLKYKVHQRCLEYLKDRFNNMTTSLQSISSGLKNETKSSAGDKHETGRAMLHLEMEKTGQQMKVLNEMKLTLEQIDLSTGTSNIGLGSLVTTTRGNFYLAISAGEMKIDDFSCFAVSIVSPIGKDLVGKKVGDQLKINGAYIIQIA